MTHSADDNLRVRPHAVDGGRQGADAPDHRPRNPACRLPCQASPVSTQSPFRPSLVAAVFGPQAAVFIVTNKPSGAILAKHLCNGTVFVIVFITRIQHHHCARRDGPDWNLAQYLPDAAAVMAAARRCPGDQAGAESDRSDPVPGHAARDVAVSAFAVSAGGRLALGEPVRRCAGAPRPTATLRRRATAHERSRPGFTIDPAARTVVQTCYGKGMTRGFSRSGHRRTTAHRVPRGAVRLRPGISSPMGLR